LSLINWGSVRFCQKPWFGLALLPIVFVNFGAVSGLLKAVVLIGFIAD